MERKEKKGRPENAGLVALAARAEKKSAVRFTVSDTLVALIRCLFLLCGIFGIIFEFQTLPNIEFDPVPALWLSGGMAFLLCLTRRQLPAAFWILLLGSPLVTDLFIHRHPELFYGQFDIFSSWINGIYTTQSEPVTELVCLAALTLVLIVAFCELVWERHLVTYLLVMAAFLVPPFFGAQPTPLLIGLIGAFHVFFAAGSQKNLLPDKRFRFQSRAGESRAAAAAGLFAVLLLLLALAAAGPLTERYETWVYETSLDLEDRLILALDSTFSSDEGAINRGSNALTPDVVFTATLAREPAEPIYLIRFRGGDYEDSRWETPDENDLYADVAASYGLSEADARNMFTTLYFQWNYVGVSGIDAFVREIDLSSDKVKYAAMRPYYSLFTMLPENDGSFASYSYYYEQNELTPFSEDSPGWYGMREMEEVYAVYAEDTYTAYPENELPMLADLVAATPLTDLNEITSFILYTLGSHAQYTMRPGFAPFNRDIVEHFLFVGGLGYCQHYASTAALMYRMYGIPARYVTGFRLDPDDFTAVPKETGDIAGGAGGKDLRAGDDSAPAAETADPGESSDGEGSTAGDEAGGVESEPVPLVYQAEVPGQEAHAWVEIFLRGYGWVPVEVTPAPDGGFYPSYPGFDAAEMRRIQREHGWLIDQSQTVAADPEVPAAATDETDDTGPEAASSDDAAEDPAVEAETPEDAEPDTVDNTQDPDASLFPDAMEPDGQAEEGAVPSAGDGSGNNGAGPAPDANGNKGGPSARLAAASRLILRLSGLAAFAALLFGLLFLRRRRALRRLADTPVNQLFRRLMRLYHDCGYLEGIRGDDPALPEKMAAILTAPSPATASSADASPATDRSVDASPATADSLDSINPATADGLDSIDPATADSPASINPATSDGSASINPAVTNGSASSNQATVDGFTDSGSTATNETYTAVQESILRLQEIVTAAT
ncbi:MAG: hypothetical protein K5707_09290, partial [Clostridia bacterium]|nr:hypothetical protein [Clostridia bacterium]